MAGAVPQIVLQAPVLAEACSSNLQDRLRAGWLQPEHFCALHALVARLSCKTYGLNEAAVPACCQASAAKIFTVHFARRPRPFQQNERSVKMSEQIVKKLWDTDAMMNASLDRTAVLQTFPTSLPT